MKNKKVFKKYTEKKEKEYKRFMEAEIGAIDKSKYIESQKANRDLYYDGGGNPSQEFYFWWIKSYGKTFREAWKSSACRSCDKVASCKDCLLESCENFVLNPEFKMGFFEKFKNIVSNLTNNLKKVKK